MNIEIIKGEKVLDITNILFTKYTVEYKENGSSDFKPCKWLFMNKKKQRNTISFIKSKTIEILDTYNYSIDEVRLTTKNITKDDVYNTIGDVIHEEMDKMTPKKCVEFSQSFFKDYYLSFTDEMRNEIEDKIGLDIDNDDNYENVIFESYMDVIGDKYSSFFKELGVSETHEWLNQELNENEIKFYLGEDIEDEIDEEEIYEYMDELMYEIYSGNCLKRIMYYFIDSISEKINTI